MIASPPLFLYHMPMDEPAQQSSQILRVLVPVLNSDLINIFAILWRLGKRILIAKAHEGMYEVLDLDCRLELKDTKGHKAVLYKREKVRFLQDNIIAYQDKAWGDGEIFADYKCSPGIAVDQYREGYRYRILISLRSTKRRGDTEEFHIERSIRNGFTRNTEGFQIDIDHPTRKFSLSIVFPQKRFPNEVTLVEKNSTRTMLISPEKRQLLPDGRQQLK